MDYLNCNGQDTKQRLNLCQTQVFQNQKEDLEKNLFIEKLHLPIKKEIIQVSSLMNLQKITNMKKSGTDKNQWTSQQEQLLLKLHLKYGNKWSIISTHIPGNKQDNDVKNKFYSTLRKGFRKMNNYITNVRRKIYKSQIAANKLIKLEFLTKLSAVADRNFLEKYEVKQKAIDLSRIIQQKLIELSKNTDDYKGNDSKQYVFQQLLLTQIQQFNRNCKKRKGKRKVKTESKKRNELFQSKSLYQSQILDDSVQISQQVSQKNQENKQIQIKKQKEEQAQQNKEVKILSQVENDKQTLDKKYNFPLQDQLNYNAFLKSQPNTEYIRTPYSMISTRGSLVNFIGSSPLGSCRSNFQQAYLTFPVKMQTSLQISKNSQSSMQLKSSIDKQKSKMKFIQQIPMVNQSNAFIFTSAQLGRISEVDNQQRSDSSKKMSSSLNYDDRKSYKNMEISQSKTKLNRMVSAIEQQKQFLQQKQVESQEKNKK